jgi:uncharacterized protein (TIGR02246 family)
VKSCVLCDEPAEPGDRFCAACGAPIVEITRATKSNELIEPATVTVTVEPALVDANTDDGEGRISASTLDCIEENLARLVRLSKTTRAVTGAVPVSGSDVVTDTGAQHEESEVSIRSIVAAQVVAWDAGDGHAYARHLAADVSFTNLFGAVKYGASAFAQRHAEILATCYRGTTMRHLVHRIRFVTPDVAIVDIDNEVHGVTAMPEGLTVPPDGTLRTHLMEVFVRRDDRWWIEAYHSVDVKQCVRRDSNPQPSDPKSEALSIELRTRRHQE